MTLIPSREKRDKRKQFVLSETTLFMLKQIAKEEDVSENQIINCLIKFEYENRHWRFQRNEYELSFMD